MPNTTTRTRVSDRGYEGTYAGWTGQGDFYINGETRFSRTEALELLKVIVRGPDVARLLETDTAMVIRDALMSDLQSQVQSLLDDTKTLQEAYNSERTKAALKTMDSYKFSQELKTARSHGLAQSERIDHLTAQLASENVYIELAELRKFRDDHSPALPTAEDAEIMAELGEETGHF